ncbi:endolytic transglycosylase MltG [Paraoerskovia marina]|uniref:Endolytic murein transglycosylase n=1 Tax=Paraoerskovia marina TaxID=545619 RepID=A0A1H1SN43_9CELL|nr:endolytic transglycosylase MltG [Paraoerskovia marina]SDS49420.1 UPF0755 protein [Paraoerskovia marina]
MSDLFPGTSTLEAQQPPAANSRTEERRRRRAKQRKRQRRRNALLAIFLILVIVAAVAYVLRPQIMAMVDDFRPDTVADYAGPGTTPVDVTIEPGSTGYDMAAVLEGADVVASQQAFVDAFEANPSAGQIQAGTFTMLTQMDAQSAVARLVANDSRAETKLTIPEGYTVDQVVERAASVTGHSVEEYEAAMEDTEARGLPAEAGGDYEGWMFPTTYLLPPDSTPATVISQMVTQTTLELDSRNVPEEDREEVLNKASLVEREAKAVEDRPKMARAIENRLDVGQRLEIDAAVAYGLGISGTELTREDTDDPSNEYNLYEHAGLPPTPIANPGGASIDAVLEPADGAWVFWTAVNLDTGETKFAETFEEHQQNVAELREWQAANG